jgi:hypothetical protein
MVWKARGHHKIESVKEVASTISKRASPNNVKTADIITLTKQLF